MSEAEINRAVAERVMGWKAPTGYRNIRADAFQPITNPADAMVVLKRCVESTDQISIVNCGPWVIICEGDGNGSDLTEAEAETLELAICQFALKLFP